MADSDIYKTINTTSEGVYKEKGSKFLAFAYPVSSEDEIKEHVAELKKQFYDARHHCYSWKLGVEKVSYRINDDGEPSGTAGKPIYGQILSHELTNVLIVVVRYFGGTKLGTSGLIHAYKSAAQDAIRNNVIEERTIQHLYQLEFDYGVMNDVMRILKEEEPQIIKQNFDLSCVIEFSTRQTKTTEILSRLQKLESVKTTFLTTI
jgi:uncharacterized YigZ family protein